LTFSIYFVFYLYCKASNFVSRVIFSMKYLKTFLCTTVIIWSWFFSNAPKTQAHVWDNNHMISISLFVDKKDISDSLRRQIRNVDIRLDSVFMLFDDVSDAYAYKTRENDLMLSVLWSPMWDKIAMSDIDFLQKNMEKMTKQRDVNYSLFESMMDLRQEVNIAKQQLETVYQSEQNLKIVSKDIDRIVSKIAHKKKQFEGILAVLFSDTGGFFVTQYSLSDLYMMTRGERADILLNIQRNLSQDSLVQKTNSQSFFDELVQQRTELLAQVDFFESLTPMQQSVLLSKLLLLWDLLKKL